MIYIMYLSDFFDSKSAPIYTWLPSEHQDDEAVTTAMQYAEGTPFLVTIRGLPFDCEGDMITPNHAAKQMADHISEALSGYTFEQIIEHFRTENALVPEISNMLKNEHGNGSFPKIDAMLSVERGQMEALIVEKASEPTFENA
jgi:hypothetical protein